MKAARKTAPEEMMREVSRPLAERRSVRAWAVVHACDFARDIADVVEAQVSAGMRPYLLTVGREVRGGEDLTKASIVQTWNDVRKWKKSFDESGAHTTPELIHAHSFPAGMAAVRLGACLVYDLRQTIEERLIASGTNPGTWLKSSFRTAEQFVLSQAAGIAVHTREMREECLQRGTVPESVFMIPDPLELDEQDVASMSGQQVARIRETRSPQCVAEMYDELYRYAFMRKRKGDSSGDQSGTLIPIPANL
jgi:hypothetical protein